MASSQPTCPHCGAAIEQNSLECPYCHAALQTEICPKCFGLMFTGSKFCPHCGAIAEKLAPEGTKLPCPRCKTSMKAIAAADIPLDECQHCGGLWISQAAFDHICSDSDAQTAASGLNLPPPVPRDISVHYLSCPQCGKLMNRHNYADGSGFVINTCKGHGVWLDRDEMRQIIEFIRAGGMRKLVEQRAREAHVEALEAEASAMRAGGQPLDTQGWLTMPAHTASIFDLLGSFWAHL